MKIIPPSHEILFMPEGETILKNIELAGRTCYKSEHLITEDSARKFIGKIIRSGHHSVIEHMNITVQFICDRGVTHELVRHRLAAYSQESTRYANYSRERFGNEITVIRPMFWPEDSQAFQDWKSAMETAERIYLKLLAGGAKPEEARSVLPNSLKTEIIMTANLREWRHVIGLRCSGRAHPQIRELILPLLDEFHDKVPVVFEDLFETYSKNIAGLKKQS